MADGSPLKEEGSQSGEDSLPAEDPPTPPGEGEEAPAVAADAAPAGNIDPALLVTLLAQQVEATNKLAAASEEARKASEEARKVAEQQNALLLEELRESRRAQANTGEVGKKLKHPCADEYLPDHEGNAFGGGDPGLTRAERPCLAATYRDNVADRVKAKGGVNALNEYTTGVSALHFLSRCVTAAEAAAAAAEADCTDAETGEVDFSDQLVLDAWRLANTLRGVNRLLVQRCNVVVAKAHVQDGEKSLFDSLEDRLYDISRGVDGIISDPEVRAIIKELREAKVKQDVKTTAAGAAAANKGGANRQQRQRGGKKAGDKKPAAADKKDE